MLMMLAPIESILIAYLPLPSSTLLRFTSAAFAPMLARKNVFSSFRRNCRAASIISFASCFQRRPSLKRSSIMRRDTVKHLAIFGWALFEKKTALDQLCDGVGDSRRAVLDASIEHPPVD